MTKSHLATALVTITLLATACSSTSKIENQAYPIYFDEMYNYYVLNTIEDKQEKHLFINNQQEFDRYFGAAAVMGPNGRPTPVDFKTQYVVAIVMPTTNRATTVSVHDVAMTGNTVVISYRVKKEEKLGYYIRPFTLVALDKPPVDSQLAFIFKKTK